MGEMTGLSAIVAGGASGLGATVSAMMAERGARAIGVIDTDVEGAAGTANAVREAGADASVAIADIRTADAAHAAFERLVRELGRVDTLVNCAAVYPRRPILEITDDEWDLENAVNIKGTYHLMVAAVHHMRGSDADADVAGRIVNITSVDAFKAHPANAHYAATKAAVASLTRSFADEFAADGILVNSVAPAAMATERAQALGIIPELAAASPLGRVAEPVEIAEFVLMIGSARNSYMTGENVIVSGGYIYA